MPSTITQVQNYLEEFGWLESHSVEDFGFALRKSFVGPVEEYGVLDERTQRALILFQERYQLPITGDLNEKTLEFMETPRCGFVDVGDFVLQGNKWDKLDLTYGFLGTTDDMPDATMRAAVRKAFDLWQNVCRLTFREVHEGHPEIKISFVKRQHTGCSFAFDGPGRTLAHAYFPPPNGGDLAGDIHMDEDENWVVSGSGMDLITIIGHEIGHTMGFGHSADEAALMYAYYRGRSQKLGTDDRNAAVILYGARTSTPTTEPPAPEPPAPPSAPPVTLPSNAEAAHALGFLYPAFYRKDRDMMHPVDVDRIIKIVEWLKG